MKRYAIIKITTAAKSVSYEAHSYGVGFKVFGPNLLTHITGSDNRERCEKYLLAAIGSSSHEIVNITTLDELTDDSIRRGDK